MNWKKTLLLFIMCATAAAIKAQSLSEKATDFLNLLSEELRTQALFELEDEERYNMNYVPIPRKGPTFHDFNEKQKAAALDLLQSSLGKEGFRKSQEIMALEKVLRIIENNDDDKMPDGRPRRDPLNYHFCIFGDPASKAPWGWRFEGHHISLSFTSSSGKVSSSTPAFFGTNPAIVKSTDQKGKEVLKEEASLGFQLINSMNEMQLKSTRFNEVAPYDISSLTNRKVETLTPLGISYTALSEGQREIMLQLLNVYLSTFEPNFESEFWDKIRHAGIENLSFAWAGSLQPGAGHYYRIQGPSLLIEYDNTQNDANHAHAVVRDLTNDYGEDVLKEHYKKHHN
ncbi:MAG: DUF3500 domain-containing protein [Maribacter sp.]|uniref:DUF3500 domain-containing protein n=1 Tax=Maribacter sp. TaxID=1897614 RepID=UPI003296BD9D